MLVTLYSLFYITVLCLYIRALCFIAEWRNYHFLCYAREAVGLARTYTMT